VTAGGPTEGRGHLARSISISEALTAAGASVTLELLRGEPTAAQAGRLRELGVGRAAPAELDAVLVDLPDPNEIGDRWPADLMAVFDDREWFLGAAALVIQPSLDRWSGSGQVERVLAGYAYAPIRGSLLELAANPPLDGGEVLVCFGGSDPADVGGRIAPTVASAGPWSTTIVVGPDYRGRLREAGGTASVVRDPADLDHRLASAALVVGGAGTMKFELALLGRPMLLLAVVDDQLPVGPPFAATGAARYIGDGREIDPAEVAAAVDTLMADDAARAAMGARGRATVDGRGGERIAAAVLQLGEVDPHSATLP
jgi:spore coat polysaccharide biosynthesis predicted glycosyltransferase SpsG